MLPHLLWLIQKFLHRLRKKLLLANNIADKIVAFCNESRGYILQTKCVSERKILKQCHVQVALVQLYIEQDNGFRVLLV